MLWNQIQQEATVIGWDFYGPILIFVALIAALGWMGGAWAEEASGKGFSQPPRLYSLPE